MDKDKLILRREELLAKRDALVDAIADCDTQSATISAGGGSKSYTNRSVDDMKKKLKFVDKEIARINCRLGLGANPDRAKTIYPRYV